MANGAGATTVDQMILTREAHASGGSGIWRGRKWRKWRLVGEELESVIYCSDALLRGDSHVAAATGWIVVFALEELLSASQSCCHCRWVCASVRQRLDQFCLANYGCRCARSGFGIDREGTEASAATADHAASRICS